MHHESLVLIVDDDLTGHAVFRAIFQKEGYRLEFAADGMTAVAKGENLVLLAVTDISRRLEAERRTRESEARKAASLESALDSILSIDHTGRVIDFNPAAKGRSVGPPRTCSVDPLRTCSVDRWPM